MTQFEYKNPSNTINSQVNSNKTRKQLKAQRETLTSNPFGKVAFRRESFSNDPCLLPSNKTLLVSGSKFKKTKPKIKGAQIIFTHITRT